MRYHTLFLAVLSTFAVFGAADADVIVDFEDIPLAPGGFDNGNPGTNNDNEWVQFMLGSSLSF